MRWHLKCMLAMAIGLWLGPMLSPLAAQSTPPCIPIWQGFSQTWGYNHRIARLGDWVQSAKRGDSCIVQSTHAAASGSGSDIAEFKQYYAVLNSELLQSQEGKHCFELSGKEGEFITEIHDGEAAFPEISDPDAQYEVLLNGFDLVTANGAKADKILSLDIAVDSVWRDVPAHLLRFKMRVAIKFACSSAECEALNQIVDYQLCLHWLAIGGHGFQAQRSTFGSGRDWEKVDTAAALPLARVAMVGPARYPRATAGIVGLHLQLDDEHHMQAWESRLKTTSYENGLLLLQVGMVFKENGAGMHAAFKDRYEGRPKPPAKWVVKRKAGSMAWEMDVAMLQFEEATIRVRSRSGAIRWSTKHKDQATADGEKSVDVRNIAE